MSDFLERLFKAMNQSKVPYLVTGAEAVAVYGKVRTTRDCDVIAKDASKSLVEALKNNGFSVHELVRGHNSVMDTKSSKYIDLAIDPDKDFTKYRIIEFKEFRVRFTTPEELILKKLEFSGGDLSSVDVDDVVSIMLRQRNKLDLDYLMNESQKRGTYKILQDIIMRVEKQSEK